MRLRKNTTAFGFELPETERDPRDGRWSFLESKDLEADKAVAAPTMVAIWLEACEREREKWKRNEERKRKWVRIYIKKNEIWVRENGRRNWGTTTLDNNKRLRVYLYLYWMCICDNCCVSMCCVWVCFSPVCAILVGDLFHTIWETATTFNNQHSFHRHFSLSLSFVCFLGFYCLHWQCNWYTNKDRPSGIEKGSNVISYEFYNSFLLLPISIFVGLV